MKASLRDTRPKSKTSIAISAAVHVVAAAALMSITFHYKIDEFFERPEPIKAVPVRYVKLAPKSQPGAAASPSAPSRTRALPPTASGEPYRYALRPEENFLIDLDRVPSEVLKRARLLYLNYPNNPTAAIAPREYLASIVKRCRELDILLVYDNAYSEMAFDGYVPPSIFEIDGAWDTAIEFHSLSKTYNMTGWRCGWAVGRPQFTSVLSKIKSFTDTGQFMAVQAAGVAALESHADFVPRNLETFKQRRDAAVNSFRAAGFKCEVPRATMYLWIQLPEDLPSATFADRVLEEQGVVVMPGSAFGAGGEGFFRISFITSPERIAEAASRAGKVLSQLTAGVT